MSTDARPSVFDHATEEILEEYSFGRISEPQLGRLEEHLLICTQCQSALEDIDEYKVFIKAGLASFEGKGQDVAGTLDSPNHPGPLPRLPALLRKALDVQFAWPRMIAARNLLAAAVLLVLAGTTLAWWMQSSVAVAPLATVRLVALRGGEGDAVRAPFGHPLDLVFGRTDLPADLSYWAEVVNSSGRQVWSGSVRIAGQSLSIRVDGPLRAGAYWVRLYSSTGELLREFGLDVG